jgi:Tfp pilus assembly protein PilF
MLEKIMSQKDYVDTMKSKTLENINSMLKICDRKIAAWQDKKRKMSETFKGDQEKYGSHLESGYFYFRTGNFERAAKSYLRATESNDREGLLEAYYGLAHSYLELDDPDNAVSSLEKAIEADPSNPLPYRDLGLIAIHNNNVEPAESFLAKAIELAPAEAELYKPLASLYMGIGEREMAVALYENALQNNADNHVINQELAAIYKDTITEAESG